MKCRDSLLIYWNINNHQPHFPIIFDIRSVKCRDLLLIYWNINNQACSVTYYISRHSCTHWIRITHIEIITIEIPFLWQTTRALLLSILISLCAVGLRIWFTSAKKRNCAIGSDVPPCGRWVIWASEIVLLNLFRSGLLEVYNDLNFQLMYN